MGNLPCLRIIYLPFNKIEKITNNIQSLHNLEVLYLYDNKTIKIISSFDGMKKLKYVNLYPYNEFIDEKYLKHAKLYYSEIYDYSEK